MKSRAVCNHRKRLLTIDQQPKTDNRYGEFLMSKRYTIAHKKLILKLLTHAFKRDVMATARFCEVPERTLRDWIYSAKVTRMAAGSRLSAAAMTRLTQRRIVR